MKHRVLRIGAVVCLSLILSVNAVVFGIEIPYRLKDRSETFGSAMYQDWMANQQYEPYFKDAFVLDPDFGFRPKIGTRFFDEYGIAQRAHPKTDQPRKKVLFIGDSVTQAGKIIDGLKKYYGESKYEYLNAGIGSYNTVQEVEYYLKYNAAVHPDIVILTFTMNDFDTTPVAFYDNGNLMMYSPKTVLGSVNPWLFQHSYTYRLILGWMITHGDDDKAKRVEEVDRSIAKLQAELLHSHIPFAVVISPVLEPLSQWAGDQLEARSTVKAILDKYGIYYIDLSDSIDEGLKSGIKKNDAAYDIIHPGDAMGRFLAGKLFLQGLFENSRIGRDRTESELESTPSAAISATSAAALR